MALRGQGRTWWTSWVNALLVAFLLALPVLPLLADPAWAQSGGAPAANAETEAWERTAARAEAALEAGRASDAALEALRAELVSWREDFLKAQGANAQRIANLRRQLAVLGDAPDEGGESAEIAARRSDLTGQLSRLLAPVLAAEEAHSRASGLIAEIDSILRNRQADALVSLGPSPINPVLWPDALVELSSALTGLRNELQGNLDNELRQFEFRQNLLVTLPLTLFGFVLLLRGRRWAGGLAGRLRHLPGPLGEVWSFLVSMAKVAMPWAGLLLLTQAVLNSGFIGLKGEVLLAQLPLWGAIILAARWLCERLFPDAAAPAAFDVPETRRGEMRRLGVMLGLFVVLAMATQTFAEVTVLTPVTAAVLSFPVLVLTSLALARLARVIRGMLAPRLEAAEESVPFRLRAVRLLAQGALIIAMISPVLAAVGYRNAAEALVYPAAITSGLLGLLFALQYFTEQAYALATKRDGDPGEALIPALIGVALVALSLPVLALVWGMRFTDLTELWSRFLEGLTIGDTRISPSDFLSFVLLFAIGYVITRMLQNALKSSVLPKTRIDQGGQTAIVSGVGYIGITIAAVVAITGTGLDLSSIAIVAGALSVGIGFGLQTIVSNFVSGIILLIERPISEGDWIEVGGQMGYVRDISVRATRIETFDRTDVIIPNADLVSGTVTNFTRGNTVGRVILRVGVAYGTDTRRVEAILREIAEAHPMVVANPAPAVLFQGFGADSLDFEIRAILRDVNWSLTVRSELNHAIAARFTEEDIEIPFAQRDIWLRNPEALHPTGSEPAQTGEAGKDEASIELKKPE